MNEVKLSELKDEIKARLAICNTSTSTQYLYSEELMEFVSGVQHSQDEIDERESNNRPTLETLNVTRKYINNIVNAVRQSPNGISVSLEDPKLSKALNDEIHSIEASSNADEAYETAFEQSVMGGIGYIVLSTDYKNDETLEQEPIIESVDCPFRVYIDPNSTQIDGSDAEYGFVVKYKPNEFVENEYGATINTNAKNLKLGMYKGWESIPKNHCPVITYFRKKEKKVKRWFFIDGTFVDQYEKPEGDIVGKREVEVYSVDVFKIVGDEIVEENNIPISYIPIVPVYGDRVHRSDGVKWVGITEWLKAPQRMVNRYHNQEIEISENTPISPLISTAKSIKGYEPQWRNHNKVAYATLVVNDDTPMPTRLDSNSNTQATISSKQSSITDAQSVTGIYDSQMGNNASNIQNAQSGTAISLLQGFGERTNAQWYQNLAKSIQQVGRILVELIAITNPQLGMAMRAYGMLKIKVETSVGAILQTNKQRNLQALTAIQGLLPEDKKTTLIDIFANEIESKDGDLIKQRVKKLLPIEFQDQGENAPDPKAMEALNAANQALQVSEQQVEMLKQYVVQLQNQLTEMENDQKLSLVQTQLKNQNNLELQAMKEEGLNQRQIAKMIEDANKRQEDKITEVLNEMKKFIPITDYNVANLKADLKGNQTNMELNNG